MKITQFKTNASDLDSLGELPGTYGRNSIVLIAQEPHRLFSYWDIDISKHPGGQTFLRIYQGGDRIGTEMEATFEGRHLYIPVQSAGETYSVEIGYYRKNMWNPIARSNPVKTPRETLSDSMEFDWATIPHDVCLPMLLTSLEKKAGPGETLVQTLGRLQRNDVAIATLLSGFLKSCLAEAAETSPSGQLTLSSSSLPAGSAIQSVPLLELSSWLQAAPSSWAQPGETSWSSASLSSWLQAVTSSWAQSGETSWSSAVLSSWLQAVTSSWAQSVETSWSSASLSSWLQAVTSSWAQSGETSWSSAVLSSWLQAVASSWAQSGETSWSSASLSSWLQAVTSSRALSGESSFSSASLSSWLQAVTSSRAESSRLKWVETGGIFASSSYFPVEAWYSGNLGSSQIPVSFSVSVENTFSSLNSSWAA